MESPLCPCPEEVVNAASQAPTGASLTHGLLTPPRPFRKGDWPLYLFTPQAGRTVCLPCRAKGSQGPAFGISLQQSQEHPLLQGLCLCRQPGVYQRGKKVKTCTSCLQLYRSPLGTTEGWPISSPPSEVHMHAAAGKNTSGKVNISRDFCSSPLTFSIPDGYLQKTNTASCLDEILAAVEKKVTNMKRSPRWLCSHRPGSAHRETSA